MLSCDESERMNVYVRMNVRTLFNYIKKKHLGIVCTHSEQNYIRKYSRYNYFAICIIIYAQNIDWWCLYRFVWADVTNLHTQQHVINVINVTHH